MAAAVNADTFAGNEVGLDQEEHGLGDFLRATPSLKRRVPQHLVVFVGRDVGGRRVSGPGATALTRISGAKSSASDSVSAATAALEA